MPAPAMLRIPVAPEAAEAAFAAADLSARELDAVRSVLAGMTAQDAAALMGVSASAVSSYRQRAYAKLGVVGARELRERFAGSAGDEDAEDDAAATDARRATLLELGLSETEASVLALVAAGRSTAQIAERLCVAPGTVSAARAHGYRYLGVHAREELADLLASSAPRSPWPRRLFLVANALVIVTCLGYEAAYRAVLWERVGTWFETVWAYLILLVTRPALALCAAQLAGFALGSRLGARARLPRWLAPVAAAILALYAATVALLPTGLLPHELRLWLSSLVADGLWPVALSLVMGLALGACAGARLSGREARPQV